MDSCQQATQAYNMQNAANPDDAMQEVENLVKSLEYIPPLDIVDFACDHIDPSIYNKKGVILQVCNTNASAHATVIGGIRLALTDIRKVPAYLQRYRPNIKKVAVRILQRHLQESQCSAGLHETLTLDDYGMTFTVATLSDKARQFNPQGRSEAPLFFCVLPAMLEPTVISTNEDGTYETGHLLNLYIHLLPSHHRRVVLARKPASSLTLIDAGEGPIIKKQRPSYDTRDPRLQDRSYAEARPYDNRRQNYPDTRQLYTKVAELDKKLTDATIASAFPPLPASKKPTWNVDDTEELPEN